MKSKFKFLLTLSTVFIFTIFSSAVVSSDFKSPLSHTFTNDDEVMTAKKQAGLKPDDVLKDLMDGNKRFVAGKNTDYNLLKQATETASGQYPKAVILACIDSRVPVEYIFDQGIGDVFVARVAGNFENTDILGSMEYGVKVAGSKLILVLGHEHCGAVKSAINGVELGNITAMLEEIKPAIEKSQDFKGEKTSKNEEFVAHVCENNVLVTMNDIREKSPILKEMEDKGELMIVGAVYDLDSGKVTLLD